MELTIGHLYPDLMNIYGDRGNILCLVERCRRRGIRVTVVAIGLGDPFDPRAYDLVFIGGSQDKEQRWVAQDLVERKGPALRDAVEDGLVVLAVCGGYQLFGHAYRPSEGLDLPGLGIFDITTVHPGPQAPRCIGNIVARWEGGLLVGFENHGGRTYLGPQGAPLARVVAGFGNNAEDGTEGARYQHAFGTYLHGSLLPKNPEFADFLIGLALERKYGPVSLPPLPDTLEHLAHDAAVRRVTGGSMPRRST
ncbi:MAG: glutamine amidotransferase [Chloroflexi bacterium]|nr:glutamine amidotransferase [Chloroflexota bacterium]